MKERWRLIHSGVHRSSIKIKDNRLFVDKKLHGSVVDNMFKPAQIEQCEQREQCKHCGTIQLDGTPVMSTEPRGIVENNIDNVSPCPSVEAVAQEFSPPIINISEFNSPITPTSVAPPKSNNLQLSSPKSVCVLNYRSPIN